MGRQTMPVDKAIDMLDDWAATIAGHVASDKNSVRVGLEARYALENIEAIAKAALPAHRQSFYRAASSLLSVIQPLLGPADRAACDGLRSVIEGGRDR